MTHLQSKIPFSGFYNTLLSELPFDSLEYCSEGLTNDEYIELCDIVRSQVDIGKVENVIAAKYVEFFSEAINTELNEKFPLELVEIQSPEYYNFENDEIIVNIDLRLLKRIIKNTKREILEKYIKERHSSYDGFISFYSNDINDWNKKASEFDVNEICTILTAFCIQQLINVEYETYEYCSSNEIGQAIDFVTDETARARINKLLEKNRASDAA